MKKALTLGMLRWMRWAVVPALTAALLLVFVSPAFAQDGPVDMEAAIGIDTMWLMVASVMVFFMQAGFALVEAGLTRAKNTVNILFKNLMDFVIASLAFWAIGWSFMYGSSAAGFIGTSDFFLSSNEVSGTVPTLAAWFFQLVFAGTAATIVSGAMAERTKFSTYLIYSMVVSGIIYPISGHWVWGGGWLSGIGFSDFAGSTVVHSVGGWLALVGTLALGPRIGRFGKDGKPNAISGHNMTFATLGVFILWFGWFGFNPGSQLAIYGAGNAAAVALVAANTNIAAAGGSLAAMIVAWLFVTKKPDLGQALNGALGGLVAITAPCAVVEPWSAIVIGAIGGAIVVGGGMLLETLKIDDPVGAVPVHLMAGMWGTLALGIFSTSAGLVYGFGVDQLIAQVIGVVAIGAWSLVTGSILFFGLKATVGIRVSEEEELAGLDMLEHGATAYPGDVAVAPAPAD